MPTGDVMHYVSQGPDNTGLPRADLYRKAHAPQRPKPMSIDFDALAPTCVGCGQKSGSVQYASMLCATCRAPAQPPTGRSLRDAEIAQAYRDGVSLEGLRDGFHIAPSTARRILVEQGVEIRPARRPKKYEGRRPHRAVSRPVPASKLTEITADDAAEMARQYAAGVPAARIARAFHVGTDRCKAIITAQGVEIRRPGRRAGS